MTLTSPKLRVMAEYGSSGIWAIEPIGPFRHGMLPHEKLGLPPELARQFESWISLYWKRTEPVPFDTVGFNAIGREAARQLKQFVGPETYVEYVPELPDGGLGPAEEIG
jgi:hypothetical protein